MSERSIGTSERGPALLLVDDRSENLLALEAVLEPLGHRMVRAASGEEALRHLLIDDIAVIVLDVQMPGLDGFETAAAIKERERSQDIPIIFLTALSHELEHRLRGYATGAVDYLFKPVDPDILRAKVRVFAELHLLTRSLREQAEVLARRTAELERSNADLEQFAYIASHDLQEPLRVVGGFLELLDEHLAGDEKARGWVARAAASAVRMSALVGDLLAYARIGAGPNRIEPVDLDAVLAAVLDDLGPLVEEHGAIVTSQRLGMAMGTPADVRSILQNVVGNAVKFHGDEPPKVVVRAEHADRWATVCVSDEGIGVADENLQRVFGIFERVGDDPYPGTGIGLAVARRLVERTGGSIWMERNRQQGVTVQFTLPAPPA